MSKVTLGGIVRLLEELEWIGRRSGQTLYWSGTEGPAPQAHCCALCGGVEPIQWLSPHFTDDVKGHSDGCKLKQTLNALNKLISTIPELGDDGGH